MSDDAPSWKSVTSGIVRRFEVAAAVNGQAVWNAEGSAACAKIIREMARLIDEEILKRKKPASR